MADNINIRIRPMPWSWSRPKISAAGWKFNASS